MLVTLQREERTLKTKLSLDLRYYSLKRAFVLDQESKNIWQMDPDPVLIRLTWPLVWPFGVYKHGVKPKNIMHVKNSWVTNKLIYFALIKWVLYKKKEG